MKLLVVLLSFIVIASAYQFDVRKDSVERKNSRIVGGLPSFTKWIPYQASLLMTNGVVTFRCSASLILRNLILTSAQCVFGTTGGEVWLGSVTNGAGTKVDVAPNNYYIYPGYTNGSLVDNLALVLLPTAVTLSDTIQTIDILSDEDATKTFAGQWSVVSGWGRTSSSNSTVPSTLQYKVTRAISNADCATAFSGVLTVVDSYLCVQPSACIGDAGGPLVTSSGSKSILVGTLSLVASGYCETYPSVYNRLSSYLGWIKLYKSLAENLL